ncbi:MAG: LysM peptidoglycan-binding domain-containing protein [Methylocystaceae bacterium]
MAKIKELNKLSSDKLDVGKKLQVPDNITAPTDPPAAVNRGNRVYQNTSANLQMTQPEVTSAVTVSRGAVIRRNVLAKSFGYIGRPYHYGGMSP